MLQTKNKRHNVEIKWPVIGRSTKYKAGSKIYNLCLYGNFHIMTEDSDKLLNEKNDLITKFTRRS